MNQEMLNSAKEYIRENRIVRKFVILTIVFFFGFLMGDEYTRHRVRRDVTDDFINGPFDSLKQRGLEPSIRMMSLNASADHYMTEQNKTIAKEIYGDIDLGVAVLKTWNLVIKESEKERVK